MSNPALCRDCLAQFTKKSRCPKCASPRVLSHPELHDLTIAHMDCDAFFASVEKRDNPELADKPVIIGGAQRGVVATACYIARIKGVRSAMPMFKALALCPEAVVVKHNFGAYTKASGEILDMMKSLTPLVQPLSLDEAFMDLSGTQKLHGASPAVLMAKLVRDMEVNLGLSGSIGLSHNKFLAKVASDLDKPRGFSIIGKAETAEFLKNKPVKMIWGVGEATQKRLADKGLRTFTDLQNRGHASLVADFGAIGDRLWDLSHGRDHRRVDSSEGRKSISKETTFSSDIHALDQLDKYLWQLAEQVSDIAKHKQLAGRVVTVKLKRSNHRSLTRRTSLAHATQFADRIYKTARPLLDSALNEGPFRLIGVGISSLEAASQGDLNNDLFDPNAAKRVQAEQATDAIRKKFGKGAIIKGRSLK